MADDQGDRKPGSIPDQTSTEQLSASILEGLAPTPQGVYLMIHYRCGGPETAYLGPGQSLVVGRSPPATVCIPDRALSAAHAKFTLRENSVLVEDLNSTNRTWVSGRPIEREEIELGGEVMLSPAVLVRILSLGLIANPRVEGLATFRRHLAEELQQADRFGRRPFAVLAVQANKAEATEGAKGAWAVGVRTYLQATDSMTLYTEQTALVLLRATNVDAAKQVAHKIAANEMHPSRARLVGIAAYPDAAMSAEKLIELAHAAAKRADPKQPVAHAFREPWVNSATSSGSTAPIVGDRMRPVISNLKLVAASRIPVLLLGETGTGKEVLARYLHDNGPRRLKNYIAINCGAIPAGLVESTFFGHEKGAFTGAITKQIGCFEAANGGTLFLDEIGDLPREAQVKLLRVLQDGRFSAVGSNDEHQVDVRVIAATHQALKTLVTEGRFREDLWYRLKGMEVKIPPLRERQDEIQRFCDLFVAKANKDDGRNVKGFSKEATALMHAYRWPGNVRELRNAVERAVAVAQGELIEPEDLPQDVYETQVDLQEMADGGLKAEADNQRKQLERRRLVEALQETGGNGVAAAKKLQISYKTLRRRIKELGIEAPKKK